MVNEAHGVSGSAADLRPTVGSTLFGREITSGASSDDDDASVGAIDAFVRAALEVRPARDATIASMSWEQRDALATGDTVHAEGVVTRLERGGGSGPVHFNEEIRLVDGAGRTRQRGFVRWRVPEESAGDGGPLAAVLDVGTVAWGEWLATRLGANREFGAATGTFDGSIGIGSGDHAVEFRIYRGKILEATRRSLSGVTFSVWAPEAVWVDFLTGDDNNFVRRTGRGEFRNSGSAYHYLRMIKALMTLFDEARLAVVEVRDA